MLNRIIHLSIKHKVTVLLFAAALLTAGVFAILRSDVDIFPDLSAPTVSVMTEAPGFTPEEIESAVTLKIESAIGGAPGLRRISSASANGFSVVKAEFDWGTSNREARRVIAEKLANVAAELPKGADNPVMEPESSILGEIMVIGLQSDSMDILKLRDIADRQLVPMLRSVSGVAQVTVMGGAENRYTITIDPQKLKQFGVTLAEVRDAVEQITPNIPAGNTDYMGRNYTVKAQIPNTGCEGLANSVVATMENGVIRLGDIATVAIEGAKPAVGSGAINGKKGVLITIIKQHGASTDKVSDTVEKTVYSALASYGPDVNYDTRLFRQSEFIRSSIDNLQVSLLEGAAFVAVVLFIFLMNFRTTIISLVAIPFSVLITMIVLHLLGIGINTMTLGGIAIAIGSLVDDAIVDVENVYRRLRDNRLLPSEQRSAVAQIVLHASTEVRLPILNSSLIIICSFLPLFLLEGMEGRMLAPLGVAFIVALCASTLVALTLTPVLCIYLLGNRTTERPDSEPILAKQMRRLYGKALESCLNHGKAIGWGVFVLFAVSIMLALSMGRDFLPPFNEGSITINITAPAGTTLAQSEQLGEMAEKIILSHKGVRSTARKTGRAELDEHARGTNGSEIEVAFESGISSKQRSEIAKSLRHELEILPGTVIEIGQPISHRLNAMLSGSEGELAVKITGTDLNTLNNIAKKIKGLMEKTGGLVDINLPPVLESPRWNIEPKMEVLALYGVTPAEFARTVQDALVGSEVSQLNTPSGTYSITARYGDIDSQPDALEYLRTLPVDTRMGKVALEQLADITSTLGSAAINRENMSRLMTVSANIEGRDANSIVNELQSEIAGSVDIPAGYTVSYGGMYESEQRASMTLLLASLGVLLLIFLILQNEYHNAKQSLIILVNIPLAIVGGIILLYFTYRQLNIPAIIGFISLMGISTRNGMLLISRFNYLEREGLGKSEIIMKGSSERLLPIIMTALTSALALIPLALRADEPGNEIQAPMAVVILGGLLTSTFLNIFVVPILYRSFGFRKMNHNA